MLLRLIIGVLVGQIVEVFSVIIVQLIIMIPIMLIPMVRLGMNIILVIVKPVRVPMLVGLQ